MQLRFAGLCFGFVGCSLMASAQNCTPNWIPDLNFGVSHPTATTQVLALATWDPDSAGPLGERVYAGGIFAAAGSVPAANIAYYDTTTTQWSPLATSGSGWIYAITVRPNGEVVAGGSFVSIDGVDANYIARWNGSSWSPMGSGIGNNTDVLVRALVTMPNGDVIVGGLMNSAGGVPANGVARWNGSSWSALGSGIGGFVRTLSVGTNGDLFVGGEISTAGGNPASHVARWDGSTWSSLGSGVDAGVYSMTIANNGDVIVGGNFSNAGGNPAERVARWNGSAWSAMGTLPQVPTTMTTLPNGDFIAAISFAIYRFNGVTWTQFEGGGNNQLFNQLITASNGDLIAGGTFTTMGGQPANKLARWGKPVGCPLLEAEFDNAGPLNLGWTTAWDGGVGGTVLQANDGFVQGASDSFLAVEAGNHVFFKSSSAWRGDRSGAYGGRLRVVADRMSLFTCNGPATNIFPDLVLEGSNLQLFRQSSPAGVLRNRLVFTAPLDNTDGGWRVGSITGPVATAQEFLGVLKTLLSIKINLNTPKQNPCSNDATYGRTLKLDTVQMFTVPLQTSFNFTRDLGISGDVGDTQGWSGDGDTTILNSPAPGVLLSDENPSGPWRNLLVADAGLGNMSEFYGDSIIYKLSTNIIQDNLMLPLVTLVSAFGDELEYYGPALPGINSFNFFSIPLSATGYSNGTGWLIAGSLVSPSENQMRKTLDNLVDIKIRCEFSQTGDTAQFKDYLITQPFSGPVCDSIDFNNDGSLFDPTDVDAFLSVFSEGPCIPASATCNDVDFNNDTSIFDPQDIDAFFSVFSEGPCF